MSERPRTATTPPPGLTAVFLGRGVPGGPVRTLIDRLASAGVVASIVDRLEDAGAIVRRLGADAVPCVVLDAVALGLAGGSDDSAGLAQLVAAAAALAPGLAPIVVSRDISAEVAIACFRAGAGDVLDLTLEGLAGGKPAIVRVARRQLELSRHRVVVADMRAMIEEFLRDLIRTERRSLDLEDKLTTRARRGTAEFLAAVDSEPARQPQVLLIEDDREVADRVADELERAGVTTFAYLSGEDAVREARTLIASDTAFDLALVDLRLPGMDGLETVRQLRQAMPDLPAFLMTGFDDPEAAADAADLGVVGYVHKPFDDLPVVVARIRALATTAMERRREHRYLRQIKDRHEHVLQRYRALGI